MKLNELSTLRLALLARETREQAAGILRAGPDRCRRHGVPYAR